ncbi:outer membrane biogenesis protein BamB [Gimesia alba]|uniref:Outer membrane biogenesis protein BamB n=1 Tax=Gimesia alba TaxID=2527973 RepID=A0A517RKA0_9PLAN|nr:PQQ-binding-like beta-propeller repeat protein [Gimesia alba]QDT44301.1 outer membrane biogenesis protein BamB [Gimesia alba]
MRRMNMVLVGSVMLFFTASLANAGDWAHWRGPEHNGISRETNLVDVWSLDGKNILWTSDIGGRSAPIVLDGRVYLNCRTHHDVTDPKDKINAQEQVVCWDAKTGKVLWKDVFNVFQTDIPSPRVGWASMAGDTETGNVFVHSVSGLFRCYSPEGKVLWETSLAEDYGKISGYGGRTQTPIVDENRVIVSFLQLNWGKTAAPPPKQTYYAFDKKTGKLLWTAAPGGAPYDTNYSVPIVTVIDGTRMLIAGNADGGCYAMNARTGEKLWGFKMSKRGLNCSPVADGKYVYISHGEDNIDTVDFGRIQCIDGSLRGDITKTGSVWRVDGIKAGYASLLVKDGILYAVADTGRMYAYDSKNGKELWTYNLGTVGKGSPVWADGKLYVMEVNGNIHILKPSREKCEELSHVQLLARVDKGMDEIYASPAIADGRIYFVTRDRTICIGDEAQKPTSDPVPPLGKEKAKQDKIASIQLVPYEVAVGQGEKVDYEILAYDANGQFIKKVDAKITLGKGLEAAKVDGMSVTTPTDLKVPAAGTISVKVGDATAESRIRVFPPLPWKFDLEELKGKAVPPAWINAFLKLQPNKVDGTTALKASPGKGRPSANIWLGPSDMSQLAPNGYTVQADVFLKEQKRKLSSMGVTVNRYDLILKGNSSKLAIQSWAPHKRMAKEVRFRADPDVWYTMKLKVDVKDGQALVKGKVWPRDKPEPKEWTIEASDPHANLKGSPGLYLYRLADAYVDNIIVSEDK